MKVKVDPDLCTACELCVDSVPDVFEMGDDVAQVKVKVVPSDLEDDVRDAADSCPAEAIIIEE
ncbi:MAG TPA: ferredoxin [bacterium]|jgi:ferredoxin|nr:ferredoxin [bacterium]HNT65801.1 ferredoxin [bacterium]HOX85693.1 ferredoxin [bacterium]HPG44852.1 ferredoxin [bacterium]HPM98119.1 ferredoxin [bacterium]